MNALSRKEVLELSAINPIEALSRCNEVLSRPTIARDTKREAWARLAKAIEAKMPKPEPVNAPPDTSTPEKFDAYLDARAKEMKRGGAKAPKAIKGHWQVDGTNGSVIVPFTRKAVKGLFGGKEIELSDDTWRYLTRSDNRRYYLSPPERQLYEYYLSIGHRPKKESICGNEKWHIREHSLLALALDGEE